MDEVEEMSSYSKLEKEIHEYFGYQEEWVTIPLYDATPYYWTVTENEHGGEVSYQFGQSFYTQRFLPKRYRTENYMMISVEGEATGRKYLMVFDNTKECKAAISQSV